MGYTLEKSAAQNFCALCEPFLGSRRVPALTYFELDAAALLTGSDVHSLDLATTFKGAKKAQRCFNTLSRVYLKDKDDEFSGCCYVYFGFSAALIIMWELEIINGMRRLKKSRQKQHL
jgi:hypothetical protein